jgi:hypothetical protein
LTVLGLGVEVDIGDMTGITRIRRAPVEPPEVAASSIV